jgi:hypothetical protein
LFSTALCSLVSSSFAFFVAAAGLLHDRIANGEELGLVSDGGGGGIFVGHPLGLEGLEWSGYGLGGRRVG